MADDAESIGQNEIEELLRQAQAGAAASAAAPQAAKPAKPAAGAGLPNSNDIEFLISHAEQALASLDEPSNDMPSGIAPFQFKDLAASPPSADAASLELVRDVQLDLKIELGRTQMHLEEVLKLKKGAVVPLDKLAGDPVDIYVNGRLIARGEVLVLNDNFCVRVAELIVGHSAVA